MARHFVHKPWRQAVRKVLSQEVCVMVGVLGSRQMREGYGSVSGAGLVKMGQNSDSF